METLSETPEENREPEITLRLSLFLDILWGYKKGAELRERAVPGKEIIAILESIQGAEKYYHIQKEEKGEDTVWQKQEWKHCGEKQEVLRAKMSVLTSTADEAALQLEQKLCPPMTRQSVKQLAYDLIDAKQWAVLEMYGVDTSKLKST